MRFRRKKEEEPSILTVPFIDCLLFLLIFFMLTTHFGVVSGLQIRLPQATKSILDNREDKVAVVIDRSGQAYLEGKKVDLKALGEGLDSLVKEKKSVRLVLQADKDVKLGVVVQVMDIAKSAGVQSIVIAAQWKIDKLM
jgi:biopolymer transport protein ExbD